MTSERNDKNIKLNVEKKEEKNNNTLFLKITTFTTR